MIKSTNPLTTGSLLILSLILSEGRTSLSIERQIMRALFVFAQENSTKWSSLLILSLILSENRPSLSIARRTSLSIERQIKRALRLSFLNRGQPNEEAYSSLLPHMRHWTCSPHSNCLTFAIWLIRIATHSSSCASTDPHLRHNSWYVHFIPLQLSHVCDMTPCIACVLRSNSCIFATWLIPTRCMTHVCVCHESCCSVLQCVAACCIAVLHHHVLHRVAAVCRATNARDYGV